MLLFSTLFFSKTIETFLKFKPNLDIISNNAFEIHFIDVGQGDATAIKFPNGKTMLVDSGPRVGRNNLSEYLDNIFFKDNYDTFDYVVLTHSDIDHSGNMEFILDNYKVNNFFRPNILSANLEPKKAGFKENNVCYDGILNKLMMLDINVYYVTNGINIDTGVGNIEMYLPNELEKVETTNDFSPFLIVSANDCKVCLSGDSGIDYEKEMINREVLSDVDLFKLGHHGSKNSNSEELFSVLKPEFVVCSVGENGYGHPSSEVLIRIAEYSEDAYRNLKTTLNDGNIIYYVNDVEMQVISITDLGGYLFVDWYLVVIGVEGLLLVNYLLIIIPKKKITINKHMKNMKQ